MQQNKVLETTCKVLSAFLNKRKALVVNTNVGLYYTGGLKCLGNLCLKDWHLCLLCSCAINYSKTVFAKWAFMKSQHALYFSARKLAHTLEESHVAGAS